MLLLLVYVYSILAGVAVVRSSKAKTKGQNMGQRQGAGPNKSFKATALRASP